MNIINITVNPPFIKLEQLLKFAGICETGGHAKIVIANGDVSVNGVICTMRGKKLHSGDLITIEGCTEAYKVVIDDN